MLAPEHRFFFQNKLRNFAASPNVSLESECSYYSCCSAGTYCCQYEALVHNSCCLCFSWVYAVLKVWCRTSSLRKQNLAWVGIPDARRTCLVPSIVHVSGDGCICFVACCVEIKQFPWPQQCAGTNHLPITCQSTNLNYQGQQRRRLLRLYSAGVKDGKICAHHAGLDTCSLHKICTSKYIPRYRLYT